MVGKICKLAAVVRTPVTGTMKKENKWVFFAGLSNNGLVEPVGQGKIRTVIEQVFFKILCGGKHRSKKENN